MADKAITAEQRNSLVKLKAFVDSGIEIETVSDGFSYAFHAMAHHVF